MKHQEADRIFNLVYYSFLAIAIALLIGLFVLSCKLGDGVDNRVMIKPLHNLNAKGIEVQNE